MQRGISKRVFFTISALLVIVLMASAGFILYSQIELHTQRDALAEIGASIAEREKSVGALVSELEEKYGSSAFEGNYGGFED